MKLFVALALAVVASAACASALPKTHAPAAFPKHIMSIMERYGSETLAEREAAETLARTNQFKLHERLAEEAILNSHDPMASDLVMPELSSNSFRFKETKGAKGHHHHEEEEEEVVEAEEGGEDDGEDVHTMKALLEELEKELETVDDEEKRAQLEEEIEMLKEKIAAKGKGEGEHEEGEGEHVQFEKLVAHVTKAIEHEEGIKSLSAEERTETKTEAEELLHELAAADACACAQHEPECACHNEEHHAEEHHAEEHHAEEHHGEEHHAEEHHGMVVAGSVPAGSVQHGNGPTETVAVVHHPISEMSGAAAASTGASTCGCQMKQLVEAEEVHHVCPCEKVTAITAQPASPCDACAHQKSACHTTCEVHQAGADSCHQSCIANRDSCERQSCSWEKPMTAAKGELGGPCAADRQCPIMVKRGEIQAHHEQIRSGDKAPAAASGTPKGLAGSSAPTAPAPVARRKAVPAARTAAAPKKAAPKRKKSRRRKPRRKPRRKAPKKSRRKPAKKSRRKPRRKPVKGARKRSRKRVAKRSRKRPRKRSVKGARKRSTKK